MIDEEANDLWFSVASVWEVAIKASLHRRSFYADPAELRAELFANAYRELAVISPHALAVGALPHIHGDPFDRMLIAQAQVEGLLLLTADATLARYPGPVRLV